MSTIVRATKLTKIYGVGDSEVRALDGLDIDLARNEFTAIMGPSGSGKSTLMHVLAGLDVATDGTVELAGQQLHQLKDGELTELRRDKIGFVFQAFNLVPTLTASENIVLPLAIAGRQVESDWFDRVVDTLGLRDRLSHKPSELSGGQQQRVACARALITKPAIIFADEPTGNLDSVSSGEVMQFLRYSVDELDQTVVIVTHEASVASYADRAIFLNDGKIIEDTSLTSVDQLLTTMAELYPKPDRETAAEVGEEEVAEFPIFTDGGGVPRYGELTDVEPDPTEVTLARRVQE